MEKPISDTHLHKLLDEVRLADEEFHRADVELKAATEAKSRAERAKTAAHNAARPHLQKEGGPVIYDGYIWRFSQLQVVHERIGRDLTPRQETLVLPAAHAA